MIAKAQEIYRTVITKTGKEFKVYAWAVLKNGWEYYMGEEEEDGYRTTYVLGFENEWGVQNMKDLEPYIMSSATGQDLYDLMPPFEMKWKEGE
jgi:hypothetical protein